MNVTVDTEVVSEMNYSNPYEDDSCYYEPPPLTNVRFGLVTILGSIISFISILENLLLFFLYASKRKHRNNHNMYLMLLAFFDFFVSLAYILLMSVNVASDYFHSPALVAMWFSYMVPMITISHIAMSSATFLIIAASFERYCLTTSSRALPWAQSHRKMIAAFVIFLGTISKVTICIEFNIARHSECSGLMTEWQMTYSEFVFSTPYHNVWRFWYRNIVTILAPFAILLYLNAMIVRSLSKTTSDNGRVLVHMASIAGNGARQHLERKASARAATRTMVAVTACYLISNVVNVLLTIFEHVDKETLFNQYVYVYAIAVDLVSLLTTLACACRLPIYLYCQMAYNVEITPRYRLSTESVDMLTTLKIDTALRQEIRGIVGKWWKWWSRRLNPFMKVDENEKCPTNSSSFYHTISSSNGERRTCTSPLLFSEPPPPAAIVPGYEPSIPRSISVLSSPRKEYSLIRLKDGMRRANSIAITSVDEEIQSILSSANETLL